jgi:ABC-2 type transport system ATP-binding protein
LKHVIEINHLKKSYGTKIAVNNLNLNVKEGEIYGLIGPNGAGKSTTIDCLLGIKKKDEGHVSILNMDPKEDRKELFAKIGVQFQSTTYPDLINVKEICQMMSSLYTDTVDYTQLLEQFGLADKANQRVASLSGGERQKLSVLISLLNKPKLIILDELTTGLDPSARREVWQLLKVLQKKGLTILLTSHYMDEVAFLCDYVMIIKDGVTVAEGTVPELKSLYNSDNLEEVYLSLVGEETYNYEIINNAF